MSVCLFIRTPAHPSIEVISITHTYIYIIYNMHTYIHNTYVSELGECIPCSDLGNDKKKCMKANKIF